MKKTIERIRKYIEAKRQSYKKAAENTRSILFDNCALQYIAM